MIEGRSPNYRISLTVAKITHQLPQYAKMKGLDKDRLIQLVLQLLKGVGEEGIAREDVYEMLQEFLSSAKSEEQKRKFISNLFSKMKKEGLIMSQGNKWILAPPK